MSQSDSVISAPSRVTPSVALLVLLEVFFIYHVSPYQIESVEIKTGKEGAREVYVQHISFSCGVYVTLSFVLYISVPLDVH